jgi:hypothetical protein
MSDLARLNEEASALIFAVVAELQPCSAARVGDELARRHGLQAPPEQVARYMEWLRSSFPVKLAHAGPDLWIVVDLS